MNVRELCRLLSATLHLPGVDRWAEQLVRRELLPGFDHEVNALDAALLLMAVVAAPRPADAPEVARKRALRRDLGRRGRMTPGKPRNACSRR